MAERDDVVGPRVELDDNTEAGVAAWCDIVYASVAQLLCHSEPLA
jgi:hypothetical protein